MSQENVEIVRRIYQAAAAGDADQVLALYDEDVEWDFSRSPFQSAGISQPANGGHDALRGFFAKRYEDWELIEDHCQELIEARPSKPWTWRSGDGRCSEAER